MAAVAKLSIYQALLFAFLILAWEVGSRATSANWISRPSLIAMQLVEWSRNDLWKHVGVTLTEVFTGLLSGGLTGIVAGLLLGRSDVGARILRPIIAALYSVPLIAMAPLLILWFGLEMAPKIVLVACVAFFILLFNTFSGVRAVDQDLVASMRLMGANHREEFQKVVLPASMVWIASGTKIALPYALAAATTGELLGGGWGVGALLSRAASRFDMTALYAALLVLMILGVAIGGAASASERHLLRWRRASP